VSEPVRDSSLSSAVQQLLTEHGPMEPDTLVQALTEGGFDLGLEPEEFLDEVLAYDETFVVLSDDRWGYLPALLAGRVFTHRVSSVELEHDVLAVGPDLEPVLVLSDDPAYAQLTDGSPLRVIFPDEAEPPIPVEVIDESGSLALPSGTLSRLSLTAGDLVGLRVTPGGVELVRAEASVRPEDTSQVRDRAVELLETQPDRPHLIETLVQSLLADEQGAFAEPWPPLRELLVAWELPTTGDLVGAPGFDFARWRTDLRLARLRQRYELSEDEALAVAAVTRLHESVLDVVHAYTAAQESGDTTELDEVFANAPSAAADLNDLDEQRERRTIAATLPFLAEPAVAQAVLRETGLRGGQEAAALGLLAETLEPQAHRAARPALRWLRAKASEELGDPIAAEQALRAAEQLDPAWPPTVIDLARIAGDRGDAAAGLALLQRLKIDMAPVLRQVLEQYRPAPTRIMPRNQPCWCGSGRKFKQCHLRQFDQLPLRERAGWLYYKAMLQVAATTWADLANELARLRTVYAETDREVRQLVDDGLVLDVTLFEGGALADFVALRGTLLPEDELLLAQQWLLMERSVFEVTAVEAGVSVSLRDIRTGDTAEASERTASRDLRVGQLICTHLLPVGDDHVAIYGGVEPVALHHRDTLVALLDAEPEPEDLVEFFTRRFAPPMLQNTEGDPLVLGKAELRSDDPAGLAAALDQSYRREQADPAEPAIAEWVETKTVDGLDRLTASLRLYGATLTITANSERRLDAVLATVRELQPSLALVADERTPLGDARTAARLAETLPAAAGDAAVALNDLPEVRAALAEQMRSYEEQWLDLPIPALAGRTPREAADDPTRRDDLVRLLASFPETDDPTAMSPARLRTALGLVTG
jgi:SEC-C motif